MVTCPYPPHTSHEAYLRSKVGINSINIDDGPVVTRLEPFTASVHHVPFEIKCCEMHSFIIDIST